MNNKEENYNSNKIEVNGNGNSFGNINMSSGEGVKNTKNKYSQAKSDKKSTNDSDDSRYNAFISYASDDIFIAESIYNSLKDHELEVWFDQTEIMIGDSLHDAISNGLNRSDYGIILFSEAYIDSWWANQELKTFKAIESNEGYKLLPIYYEVPFEKIASKFPLMRDIKGLEYEDGDDLELVVGKILAKIRGGKAPSVRSTVRKHKGRSRNTYNQHAKNINNIKNVNGDLNFS